MIHIINSNEYTKISYHQNINKKFTSLIMWILLAGKFISNINISWYIIQYKKLQFTLYNISFNIIDIRYYLTIWLNVMIFYIHPGTSLY